MRVDLSWPALFEPATAGQLSTARRILALTIGVYLAFGPYAELAGQAPALFRPVLPIRLLGIDAMPPLSVMVGLQVIGLIGAALALLGRLPRAGFAAAWVSFFVLAALASSRGKYLHNDVILLLGSAPLLFAPRLGRGGTAEPSHRFGVPLSSGLIIVVGAYFLTGLAKLANSGPAWVLSDNMRYVMADAAGHPWFPGVASFVSTQPVLSYATAVYILGLELAAPVVLFHRWTRPWFAAALVYLHVATWVTLGLDYWSWAITATALLLRPSRSKVLRSRRFRVPLV